MSARTRTAIGVGVVTGVLIAVSVLLWWRQSPSEATVRRTVITTVQEETPASFLVTGTLDVTVTVRVDSSQFLTPGWLTGLLLQTQPSVLSMLEGRSATRVRVPGRVSYGVEVEKLTPSMIHLSDRNVVGVDLPELAIHSVEPNLTRLEVSTSTEGWMRVLSSGMNEEVRRSALAGVEGAFREQAQRRIDTAMQPRINTARALETMLRAPLQAAGVQSPQFRIQVGDRLVFHPDD